jgi:hypothetical protein
MTILDEATAVTRRAEGRYDATLDARFAIVAPGGATPPAINGGVLLATVMRAVLAESPLPHPVATSAHFVRVAAAAPADICVTWLKHGRTAATARAALIQDGRVIVDTTITVGTVTGLDGAADTMHGSLTWTGPPPGFPPIEQCVNLGECAAPWHPTALPDTQPRSKC